MIFTETMQKAWTEAKAALEDAKANTPDHICIPMLEKICAGYAEIWLQDIRPVEIDGKPSTFTQFCNFWKGFAA
jgi:hypothetical protein